MKDAFYFVQVAIEAVLGAVGIRLYEEPSYAVVVSLGVDTFKDDPISRFRLESDDFTACGRRIAALGLPTLFVMEGGYAVEAIGVNAVTGLTGFEGG